LIKSQMTAVAKDSILRIYVGSGSLDGAREVSMKQVLMVCIAALMTAAFLADDAAARDTRRRVVIYAEPRFPVVHNGAIYGYAPGAYRVGPTGLLFGPYPRNPNAPIYELRY
jgi:hypothetical protein